ncbi:MAG: ATP-binding cassette domain-containing protein [Clostridia bacterium]|nr:ATP-binding cassette domain-containing protein [Clostridia bacterium]
MSQKAISFENVSKLYRLGAYGSGTLKADIESYFAKLRGKEDPNARIGTTQNDATTMWALKDVTFDVNVGDAIGIIGKNGAGKSTLLKILSRITTPTEGRIEYIGRVASMMEVGTGFHNELTGRENVYLNGAILGMSKAEVDKKFDDIVEFAEMQQFIDTPVKRYSSGMYVKLAFSVAAHLNAEIMVMDEILAVGDVSFQQKCLDKMSDIAKKEGRTILYVSHNMNTIKQLCNRCVVLEKGQLVYDGNVDDAISVYIGNSFNIQKEVDLENHTGRLKAYKSGIQLSHLTIENSDNGIFTNNDTLNIRLDIKSDNSYENSFLIRAVAKYKDDTPAGVIESPVIKGIKKGVNTYNISIPLDNFIDGTYSLSLSIVNTSVGVLRPYYDWVNNAVAFEINDSYSSNWSHTRWGHTKLGEMIIK